MRYLGIALGMAVALGYCAAFGTLMPPIFDGTIVDIIAKTSGLVILFGVAVCLGGIAVTGMAGMSKERELSDAEKKASVPEFSFVKGILVATFSGIMSAAFAYGLAAGKPIGELAKASLSEHGGSDLWQNLPVLVVVLWGGFTTNFIWCVILNIKNRSGHEYLTLSREVVAEVSAAEGVSQFDGEDLASESVAGEARTESVPMLRNYALSALAGTVWYLQFFFYSMGQTRMGAYDFSSWTLHMASIIIFSSLWGIALREWKGTSGRTRLFLAVGLILLIGSTMIVGYGNYLNAVPAAGH
jgi:L-rhamnose-H+ transport protein